MASLYQRKNGIYYLSVVFQGGRSTKSLETKSEETAKAITPYVERQLLDQLINGKQKKDITFKELVSKYLKYCLLYTSPSPRDATLSRMPSSA